MNKIFYLLYAFIISFACVFAGCSTNNDKPNNEQNVSLSLYKELRIFTKGISPQKEQYFLRTPEQFLNFIEEGNSNWELYNAGEEVIRQAKQSYTDEFFGDNYLFAFLVTRSSGDYVNTVEFYAHGSSLYIETHVQPIPSDIDVDCEMAEWLIFLEIPKALNLPDTPIIILDDSMEKSVDTVLNKLIIKDSNSLMCNAPYNNALNIAPDRIITLYTTVIIDADVVMHIDGVFHSRCKGVKIGDQYYNSFTFVMPNKPTTITFDIQGGM